MKALIIVSLIAWGSQASYAAEYLNCHASLIVGLNEHGGRERLRVTPPCGQKSMELYTGKFDSFACEIPELDIAFYATPGSGLRFSRERRNYDVRGDGMNIPLVPSIKIPHSLLQEWGWLEDPELYRTAGEIEFSCFKSSKPEYKNKQRR
jgi:hypothetical protein